MVLTGENRNYLEKTCPNVTLCVSQVTHELARLRNRVSADRGRQQLIALVLAREYVDNTKTFARYLPGNVTSLQSIF